MAATAAPIIEKTAPELVDSPAVSGGEEFKTLAFKAWQRASLSTDFVQDDWISVEESVLLPR